MIRTTFLAFTTPLLLALLAATLIAQEPANDLEEVTAQIMVKAFRIGDLDTTETLFNKLSFESKKKFLQEAATMFETDVKKIMPMDESLNSSFTRTYADMALVTMFTKPESLEPLGAWVQIKQKKTQLLGRLTLSLFEPSAMENSVAFEVPEEQCKTVAVMHEKEYTKVPVRRLTRGNEIEVVCVNGNITLLSPDSHDPPIVSVNLPHLENREQINGKYTIGPDGYLTFGAAGRVYIDGLTVNECRDAIEFHLSKFKVVPQPQPYQVPQPPVAYQSPVPTRAPGEIYTCLYYVGDLVSSFPRPPVPVDAKPVLVDISENKPARGIEFNSLIDLIMPLTDPKSWDNSEVVGKGIVTLNPAVQGIVIRQTEDAHAQIADLLNQIRKMNEQPRVASAEIEEAWLTPMPSPYQMR